MSAPQVASYQDGWKRPDMGAGAAASLSPGLSTSPRPTARGAHEACESVEHFYKLQYELIAESARAAWRQNFIDRAEHLRTLTY